MWFVQISHEMTFKVSSFLIKKDISYVELQALLREKYVEYYIIHMIHSGEWLGEVEL